MHARERGSTVEIMMVLQCALQGLAGRYKQGVGPDRHLAFHISRASYDLPFDTLCATVRSKFLERASYYLFLPDGMAMSKLQTGTCSASLCSMVPAFM